MRLVFFGADGDTSSTLDWLRRTTRSFVHSDLDIRDREAVLSLFAEHRFDLIIHCAAQPSHDLAARMPFEDWDVNATGTLNLLEAARRHAAQSPFIHLSTNKVYGDTPNRLPLVELETRYDYERPQDLDGIDESCSIDNCLHSLFGASKTAGDIAAQEYGRYFDMPVGIFRAGCLTGSRHAGAELHGFLSYLVKATIQGRPYTIFGYKGKQVRDNLHSADVVDAFTQFFQNPRAGEVYNLGGGRENSISILEAIEAVEALSKRKLRHTYRDTPRRGDHICYISNLSKLKSHFPFWEIRRPLNTILEEMVRFEIDRND
jgi:CDP-paratose 2-epimerase